MRGEREFGRRLSSQWIKVLFPLQWLITTTENESERERGGETEIKGDRDLGERQLTPLVVGLLCTLASHFRSKAHTECSSIKHSSQQGETGCAVSVRTSKWNVTVTQEHVQKQCLHAE